MNDVQSYQDVIREMAGRGASCEMIARALNRRGFLTPIRAVPWTAQTVCYYRDTTRRHGKKVWSGL